MMKNRTVYLPREVDAASMPHSLASRFVWEGADGLNSFATTIVAIGNNSAIARNRNIGRYPGGIDPI
jgi:hypothetical protein